MELTLTTGKDQKQIDLNEEELTVQVGCTTIQFTRKYIHLDTEDKRISYNNRKQNGEVLIITKED